MKRTFSTIAVLTALAWGGAAFAADAPAAKPDCSAKQQEFDAAKTAAKPQKADLTSCKDKKGKDKADCEKPLKDKAKEDTKAAVDKEKAAKKDLDCCKNPKMKGCPA
ncbi:MAG TPA: hypothetical protein VGP07_23985 [Polyangia bacterium]|jgi:hypothetical protein